jgi:hypothetical protein
VSDVELCDCEHPAAWHGLITELEWRIAGLEKGLPDMWDGPEREDFERELYMLRHFLAVMLGTEGAQLEPDE